MNLSQTPFDEKHLEDLYRVTGDGENYQGFFLFYTNEDGQVALLAKTQNNIVKAALERHVIAFADGDLGQE